MYLVAYNQDLPSEYELDPNDRGLPRGIQIYLASHCVLMNTATRPRHIAKVARDYACSIGLQ